MRFNRIDDLKRELKKIRHKYHLEATQMFKFVNEIVGQIEDDLKPIKDYFESKGYREDYKYFSEINKKYRKAMKLLKIHGLNKFKKLYLEEFKDILTFENKMMGLKLDKTTFKVFNTISKSNLKSIHKKCILNMAHIYLITLFEAFNKDFFQELLSRKPEIMISDKKIGYDEILRYNSLDEMHEFMASKKIDEISYMNIDEFASEFINKNFKIDLSKKFKKWDDIREKYYRRNIIIHNGGRISEIYAQKLNRSLEDVGITLNNDINYIKDCFEDVHGYISFITQEIFAKFKLS